MFLQAISRSVLGFIALAGGLCMTANSAIAAPEPSLICVQNQAKHLDISTGPVDGLMGRKTRDASAMLTTKYPDLKDLRPLSRDNAIVWCREIGLLDEQQAQYWPIKTEPKFEFLFSNFLSGGQQIEIQNAITFAFRYFNNYNIRLAGTIKIIASPNEAELAEQLALNSRYRMRLTTARRIIRDQCRGQDLSGLNTPGLIVLCFGPDFDWKQSYVNLRGLVTHEISHEIQRQVAGYTSLAIANNEVLVARMGPRWLVEGSAIALELKALLPYVDVNEHITMFRQERDNYSGEKLKKLNFQSATSKQHFGDYAALAGQMLANRKEGHAGYFTYWKLLARMDWEDAFTKTFGLTPEDFYKEFSLISPKNKDSNASLSSP